MKKAFKEHRFARKTEALLSQIIPIIDHFRSLGYKLTLRQLYYQLVARDIIENKQSQYQKLSSILRDARMSGRIDWDAIEDRLRRPIRDGQWRDIENLFDLAMSSYRKYRTSDQPKMVELWVEKDALASVLMPICSKWHINLVINRGYGSVSSMHDAYKRFRGSTIVVLYLGDHDPSGLDMDRDIVERMREFGIRIRFERIGLTQEQIKEFSPPPNPAKFSDPRAEDYIAQFGAVSWEVDALPPEDLHRIVEEAIVKNTDTDLYKEWLKKERRDKLHFNRFARAFLEDYVAGNDTIETYGLDLEGEVKCDDCDTIFEDGNELEAIEQDWELDEHVNWTCPDCQGDELDFDIEIEEEDDDEDNE